MRRSSAPQFERSTYKPCWKNTLTLEKTALGPSSGWWFRLDDMGQPCREVLVLVAVAPFCGFNGKPLDLPKSSSPKVQPNSSQVFFFRRRDCTDILNCTKLCARETARASAAHSPIQRLELSTSYPNHRGGQKSQELGRWNQPHASLAPEGSPGRKTWCSVPWTNKVAWVVWTN